MRRTTPAPGYRGKGLDNDFGESRNSSIISNRKLKDFNHLTTLQKIADKWVDRGCYDTPGRALRALIGGEL